MSFHSSEISYVATAIPGYFTENNVLQTFYNYGLFLDNIVFSSVFNYNSH